MKELMIEVTEELIAQASRADSSHCMIADAIKAQVPEASFVSVDLQSIRFSDKASGKRYIWLTPGICQMQLLRFDQGVTVEPWAFRLPRRPTQVVVITNHGGGKATKPNVRRRPSQAGPKKMLSAASKRALSVVGGHAPPLAVLAHAKGKRRVFGIRAAKGFDPSV